MTHSKWYETAKRNFCAGRWSEEMLRNVMLNGRITQDEYDEIVSSSGGLQAVSGIGTAHSAAAR